MKNRIKRLQFVSVSIALTLVFALMFSVYVSAEKPQKGYSGSKLWAQNCGRCHNYRGVNEFDDATWELSVSHMRVIAGLPADQARAILEYLQSSNNPPREQIISVKPEEMEVGVISEKIAQGDTAKGSELFEANCSSCHGVGGKGDGPAAASLTPRPRDLSDEAYMKALSDEYLFNVIGEGGAAVGKSPIMPAWGTVLTEADIVNIISYVRTLSD